MVGRPGFADDEAVRALVGRDAERAKSGDERRNAVAFLDAQLGGAADAHLAAVAGQRGNRRQLVDEARHLLRRDVDAADAVAFDDDRPARLAGVTRRLIDTPRARRTGAARR